MILSDQIELLRQNIGLIQHSDLYTVLAGGDPEKTRRAYEYKHLILPARDIATAISDSNTDKGNLNLHGLSKYGKNSPIHLKDFLNMIIHASYLHITEKEIDVLSDRGKKIRVQKDIFMEKLHYLLLDHKSIILIICNLSEKELSNNKILSIDIEKNHVNSDSYGVSNLLYYCLGQIRLCPILMGRIWQRFFFHSAVPINDNNVINNVPFMMEGRYSENISYTTWKIGWRRDDLYSNPTIKVMDLIDEFRSYSLSLQERL